MQVRGAIPTYMVENNFTKKSGGIPSICMDRVIITASAGNMTNCINTALLRRVSLICFLIMVMMCLISR